MPAIRKRIGVDSPLNTFRGEIVRRFDDVIQKIVELDASQKAAKGERKRGTAKGADFESRVVAEYTEMLRATNDDIEGTGGLVGAVPDSKKGDAVITINGKDASAASRRAMSRRSGSVRASARAASKCRRASALLPRQRGKAPHFLRASGLRTLIGLPSSHASMSSIVPL